MKYVLFCCTDHALLDAMPQRDWQTLVHDTNAYLDKLRASGHCLASEALESIEAATTVRVRNGRMSTTDGPFAETKEQVGGFFLIEARDLDEALQIAAGFPSVRHGSIEVRPVRGRTRCGEHR